MRQMLLLFSHRLTAEQEADARASLGVTELQYLPDDLQRRWQQVPPGHEGLAEYIRPVLQWLEQQGQPGDCLMVQGDFGMTYLAVQHALSLNMLPVYSTTRRETTETPQPDGSIRIERHFRHVRFRKYGS